MYYYSLEGPARNARVDEVLLVAQLTHARKGLVALEDSNTAVCLTNGLRLELLFIPQSTRRRYGLQLEEQATLKLRHWLRRDVLFLDNGRRVPFQKLEIGQVVRILYQPAPFTPAPSPPGHVIGTVQQPANAARVDLMNRASSSRQSGYGLDGLIEFRNVRRSRVNSRKGIHLR